MNKDKVVCLVSGGIDSPVACAMMAKRFEVILLHFCLYPLASEKCSIRSLEILRELREKVGTEKIIIFPWACVLEAIRSEIEEGYICVACRKSMFHAAGHVCERERAIGIVAGESLGQKASQTLSNIRATSIGTEYPILRPLLGFNKDEIVAKSKELGIWHPQHMRNCFATPKKPRTKTAAPVVDEKLDMIEFHVLIHEGLDSLVELRTIEENFEGFLSELIGRFGK